MKQTSGSACNSFDDYYFLSPYSHRVNFCLDESSCDTHDHQGFRNMHYYDI